MLQRARTAKAGYTVTIEVALPEKSPGDTFDVKFPDGHVESITFPPDKRPGEKLQLDSHCEPDWKTLAEICPLTTSTAVAEWSVELTVSVAGQTETRRLRLLTPNEEAELIGFSAQAQIHLGKREFKYT